MSLLPTTRFYLRMPDGRDVALCWDFCAIFAEDEARRKGETISILNMLFFMTRSGSNPPTLEQLREVTTALGAKRVPEILRAIGATKTLAASGGLPLPDGEQESEACEAVPWDWRAVMTQAIDLMNVSLEEFWRLTPFEYVIRRRAAAARENRRNRFGAAMTATLLNVLGRLRRPLSVDDLMGSGGGLKPSHAMDDAERGAAIDRVLAKVERLRKEGKLKECRV